MSPDDTTGGQEVVPPEDAVRPADPLAQDDPGVAVDDDPAQVDLNTAQWDSE